jgi:opacity protein-like surface antigen
MAGILLAAGLPMAAQAQTWEYGGSIYLWMSGLDTALDTPLGRVETELSFGDILDDLEFAAFAKLEARNGPWVLLGDINYSDLKSSLGTPGAVFAAAEVDTALTILSAYGGYAMIDRPDLRIEVGGGLRYYDLGIDASLTGSSGGAPDQSLSFSENWVDPVVGARFTAPLSDRWIARGFADAGGFGIGDASNLSWQVYVGAGYLINATWSVEFGYRHLSIDKDLKNATVEMDQYGPLVGVSLRF